jgi:hypothetical protein
MSIPMKIVCYCRRRRCRRIAREREVIGTNVYSTAWAMLVVVILEKNERRERRN